jgi:Haemolysin-III related
MKTDHIKNRSKQMITGQSSTINPYIEMAEVTDNNKNLVELDLDPIFNQVANPSGQNGNYSEQEANAGPRIVGIEKVPLWLQDNEFLITGYRVNFKRKRDLLKSLFSLHNETLNIWSHLLGALLFIGFIVKLAVWFNHSKQVFEDCVTVWKDEKSKFSNYVL